MVNWLSIGMPIILVHLLVTVRFPDDGIINRSWTRYYKMGAKMRWLRKEEEEEERRIKEEWGREKRGGGWGWGSKMSKWRGEEEGKGPFNLIAISAFVWTRWAIDQLPISHGYYSWRQTNLPHFMGGFTKRISRAVLILCCLSPQLKICQCRGQAFCSELVCKRAHCCCPNPIYWLLQLMVILMRNRT